MEKIATKKNAEALHDVLRQRILSAEYKVGERIPTERTLARAFGCSRATVSKALVRLAHDGLVKRRTRAGTQVVQNQVGKKSPAVSLDACAFIYPSEQHEGIRRIVHGFQEAAHEVKRRVVTLTTGTDFQQEAEIIGRLGEFDVKGAAVYPVLPETGDQFYFGQMLRKCPFPVVLTDVTLPGVACPAVIIDGFHAGYTMTRHLLDRGLRKIGFLTNGSWVPTIRDRYQGYVRALEEAGIVNPPDWTLLETSIHPNFQDPLAEGRLLTRQYLENARELEGVVCGDDFLALVCLASAKELGRRVPDQLKVVGMVDYGLSARGEPPLTTYHVPLEQMGRCAFQMLEQLVRGEKLSMMEVPVRGNLVVRQSG